MKPGDIVMWRDEQFGHHRFWEIRAVCLGAEKQESLVRIVSLSENAGKDENGEKHITTVVPECLLRNVIVYSPEIKRTA